MDNVLIVRTTKSNGRAWAAWYITEEKAKGLEYLISVNGKDIKAYAINDYVMGKFFGNEYERAAFDLAELSGKLADKIIFDQSGLTEAGWTIKYGSY